MEDNQYYLHHYKSPIGGITMASDGESLVGLWFDGQKFFAEGMPGYIPEKDLPVFELTDKWLDIYFSGREPDFTPPLAMLTSPFRKEVWETLLTIPYGQTVSYGQLSDMVADRLGRASVYNQAVGGAVAHNAISLIIPCHRVMGTNSSLTGYSGGVDRKAWLLRLEQAVIPRRYVRRLKAN